MSEVQSLAGNGVKTCPTCHGRGAYEFFYEGDPVPVVTECKCVKARRVILNLERAWPGLTKEPKVKDTPLKDYLDKDLWVTAEESVFMPHLRHVALRQGPDWAFAVYTDFDYMKEWFKDLKAKGGEIFDADFKRFSWRDVSDDIVEGPSLLILKLGVKAARNNAMPEVLLECLLRRHHAQRPTWLLDQPSKPLVPGHRCYSEDVRLELNSWPHVELVASGGKKGSAPATARVRPSMPAGTGGPAPFGATRSVDINGGLLGDDE